jgi:NADH-quinone oxidoreductase subunit C
MGVENPPASSFDPAAPLELLKQMFPEGVVETSVCHGEATAVIQATYVLRIMKFLKEDPRTNFDMLSDLTAADYLGREPRFDIVYNLISVQTKRRLRIKARVNESDPPVESLTPLWGAANWLEREVWDMFGIRFSGHPNLKRILMYEEFQGHPLRKDYPIRKRQPRIGPKI